MEVHSGLLSLLEHSWTLRCFRWQEVHPSLPTVPCQEFRWCLCG